MMRIDREFFPRKNSVRISLFREARQKKKNYDTRVYPKVSRLAAWSDSCKWYSSLPLGAVISLFCESDQ
jgi:hypothetical protein